MSFGKRLKQLRHDKNVTQAELGKILNVTNVGVAKWESDDRFPDKDTLIGIADYFDVSLDYLLGRVDEPQSVILTENDFPVPAEYKEYKITIEADRKTKPDVITEEMVRDIINSFLEKGYKIKRND